MNDIQHVPAAEVVSREVVTSSQALMTAITSAAANPAVDIDKMERLYQMHKDVVAREAEAEFNRALALTQKKIEPVAARAHNKHTDSNYALVHDINTMLVPIYTGEGLSVSFNTEAHPDKGWLRTVAIVSHRQGHSRRYELDMPLDDSGAKGTTNKTGVQATGSTAEYARRYLLRMIFNISTFTDRDGNRVAGPEVPEDDPGRLALEVCGSDAGLKAAWAKLDADERKRLQGVMAECRKRIREADQA